MKERLKITLIFKGVQCLGEDTCYPLAFGVPVSVGAVSVLVFFGGNIFNLYTLVTPDRSQENLVKRTLRCILVGLILFLKSS